MSAITLFDLQSDALSIRRFDKKGNLISADNLPLSKGQIFPTEIAGSFPVGDTYYLSIPLSLLNFRLLDLPFSDMKKVREMLPYELEGIALDGPESIVFDVRILGGKEGAYRALVVYVAKHALKSILERLKGLGVDPRAVFSIDLGHAVSLANEKEIADFLLGPGMIAGDERDRISFREVSSPSFNFRRDELAFTADTAGKTKALKMTAVLSALLIIGLLSDAGVNALSLRRENRLMRDGIRKVYQEVFPDDKKITDEVYQMKAHLKELREKEASFSGTSVLQALMDLTKINRPGVSLSEVTAERDFIAIKGECPSPSDAQKIKSDLDPLFGDLNISETRPANQGRTQFTIRAKGKKS